ncbi:MAG: hypothetical protein IJU44_12335, partial [Kiritimatiellae bacterium]|nr:hypothetical protein [Kiritimatiellia bacterium]
MMAYSIKIRITTAVAAIAMVAVLCNSATNKVYQTNPGPGQASPPANSGGSTNAAPGSFDALTFCGITHSDTGL